MLALAHPLRVIDAGVRREQIGRDAADSGQGPVIAMSVMEM